MTKTPKRLFTKGRAHVLSPWCALWLLLLAAFLPIAQRSAEARLPPKLQRVRRASLDYLCRLYDVSPGQSVKPISITIVDYPSALSGAWKGFPTYAAGEAEPSQGRILVVLSRCGEYPFGDAAQTLRHELSHVMLYRSLGFQAPRWFDEGLAMRAEGEWGFSDGFYSVLALPAVAEGKWRLSRVEADFQGGEGSVRRSYALAKGFVRDLFPNNADLTAFIIEARRDGSVDTAFFRRFGVSPATAFQAWAKHLPWWGQWVAWLTSENVLWILVTLLFILATVAAYHRRRIRYERLPD